MLDSDLFLTGSSRKYKSSCKFCGKSGHARSTCSALRRERENQPKFTNNAIPCRRDNHEIICNCPGRHTTCISKYIGRQSPSAHTIELTIVLNDVPKSISNLSDFGKSYFKSIGSRITWDQYRIYRPWPNNRWRDQEVCVEFKNLETWQEFQKINERKYIYQTELKIGKETLLVKWRRENYEEQNRLINKALALKSRFEGVKVSPYGYGLVDIKVGAQWKRCDEESLKEIVRILMNREKKGRKFFLKQI